MTRRLNLLVVALLASGMLAAGCGGGDDNGDGGSNSGVPAGDVKQAEANCKRQVDQAQGLSGDVKSDLKTSCEAAAKGDEDAVRKATRDVCVKIVEQNVPAGPARDQAVDACKQSGQSQ
jgi:hypothetical protein